jgi:hypothetical protein
MPTDLGTTATAASKASVCAECGKTTDSITFCPGQPCARRFHNRCTSQGGPLVPLLKAWRLARNAKHRKEVGAACLIEISAIVDMLNEADRKDGRTSDMTMDYAARRLRSGRYIDRMRH